MKRAILIGLVACSPAAPPRVVAQAPPPTPAPAPAAEEAPKRFVISPSDIYDAARACDSGAGSACVELSAVSTTPEATLASCTDECARMKEGRFMASEREQKRPKTKTASIACFSKCMTDCTGGRIKVRADGTYKDDPDDWCGTCDFSCHNDCDVRQPKK